MADKLLIRAYNVEVGDCIYCRIPKAHSAGGRVDDFHVLIDCGSLGTVSRLEAAVKNLESMLPDAGDGRKRLDLLAVSHEHKDHIAGFDPDFFRNIKIEHIWLSAAMDPEHPQAGRTFQLHALATAAMRNVASLNLALGPELEALVEQYGLANDDAMLALRETLPTRSGISTTYVHAGMTSDELIPSLAGAKIHVLNPEQDVDHYYLGKEADDTIQTLAATGAVFGRAPAEGIDTFPANISRSDFSRLQSRMMSSAFAFAELSSKVTNNTSLVLLIEWQGRRLLFVGDAEWETSFKDGKANGAWNVMWHTRTPLLRDGIDFLKVGHHGSENATPWNDMVHGEETEASAILDAILPLPDENSEATALAVVSTKRKNYETIPCAALLVELGKRVANVRNYEEELGTEASKLPKAKDFEKPWLDSPQPWRTDCEYALSGTDYVDVEIEP